MITQFILDISTCHRRVIIVEERVLNYLRLKIINLLMLKELVEWRLLSNTIANLTKFGHKYKKSKLLSQKACLISNPK